MTRPAILPPGEFQRQAERRIVRADLRLAVAARLLSLHTVDAMAADIHRAILRKLQLGLVMLRLGRTLRRADEAYARRLWQEIRELAEESRYTSERIGKLKARFAAKNERAA